MLKNSWKKLSQGQKLSALLLVAAVVASLAWAKLHYWPPQPAWVEVVEVAWNADGLESCRARLNREGIEGRFERRDNAQVAIVVRDGEDFERALFVALSELPSLRERPKGIADIFSGPDIPRAHRDARQVAEGLENTIRWSAGVDSVNVVAPKPKVRFRDEPRSAMVGLRLADDVERLTAREAAGIRTLVCAAFALEPQEVSVVDQHGNDYGLQQTSIEAIEREDEIRRKVEGRVVKLYDRVYSANEYRLVVFVDVDAPTADPPAIEPNAVEKVRVDLRLDMNAVRRVVERRGEILQDTRALPARVDEYEREQEESLSRLIAMDDISVTVRAEAFGASIASSGTRDRDVAVTAPAPEVRDETRNAGGVVGLLVRLHAWREPAEQILIGAAGLAGFLFVFAAWRALRRRRRRSRPSTAPTMVSASSLPGCTRVLRLTRHAEECVRDQPELVATILRLWITEASDGVLLGEDVRDDADEVVSVASGGRSGGIEDGAAAAEPASALSAASSSDFDTDETAELAAREVLVESTGARRRAHDERLPADDGDGDDDEAELSVTQGAGVSPNVLN